MHLAKFSEACQQLGQQLYHWKAENEIKEVLTEISVKLCYM